MGRRTTILSDEQRAEMRVLQDLQGFTRDQARYRVLTAPQRDQWAAQIRASERRRHAANPREEFLKDWKRSHRHSKPDLPFTITESDLAWPTHCPVTGIELHYGGCGGNDDRGGVRGPRDSSAALDRIDNSQGCVPGNVVIVSHWVNLRKGDASIEQLRRIVEFYERLSLARYDSSVDFGGRPRICHNAAS
jgi:hypothetical protein